MFYQKCYYRIVLINITTKESIHSFKSIGTVSCIRYLTLKETPYLIVESFQPSVTRRLKVIELE